MVGDTAFASVITYGMQAPAVVRHF